jgi:hypothetical protein
MVGGIGIEFNHSCKVRGRTNREKEAKGGDFSFEQTLYSKFIVLGGVVFNPYNA